MGSRPEGRTEASASNPHPRGRTRTNPISRNRLKIREEALSIAYSRCGTMFGVLFKGDGVPTIRVSNVRSGAPVRSHPTENSVTDMIWTHGECLRFTTLEPGSITVWEVGFASERPATRIESLPTPNNFDPSKEFLFLPTLSRLAFVLENTAYVWDAQHSRFLLNPTDFKKPRKMTFSPDGRFFACGTNGPEIYLWKDSPAGYILDRKVMSSSKEHTTVCVPILSPNGQSLVASSSTIWGPNGPKQPFVISGATLELWHTTDSTSSPSSVPTQDLDHSESFIVEFSPDKSLAVSARLADNTATVVDLESGSPRLTIDTGMKICGLRVDGSSVVVVGNGKVAAWDLPPGDRVFNAKANVNDSVRTTTFDDSLWLTAPMTPCAAISPDSKYIFIMVGAVGEERGLHMYDVSTGEHLQHIPSVVGDEPCISPDGEFWCNVHHGRWGGWKIEKDGGSGLPRLGQVVKDPLLPGRIYPWQHVCSLRVRRGGWVVTTIGERVLRLPPHWQSTDKGPVFRGRFLALVSRELSEALILEPLDE